MRLPRPAPATDTPGGPSARADFSNPSVYRGWRFPTAQSAADLVSASADSGARLGIEWLSSCVLH